MCEELDDLLGILVGTMEVLGGCLFVSFLYVFSQVI